MASDSSSGLYYGDEWPKMPDGTDYDGKDLLNLLRDGKSPFADVWDVNLLIREIEEHLNTKVVDIPFIYHGANSYGFHFKLSSRPDILARIAREDVNMPDYHGFSVQQRTIDVKFEAAVYELLRPVPDLKSSHLLYWRSPVQYAGPKESSARDIMGRRLFIFEMAEGASYVWSHLSSKQTSLLIQAAHIRASLFNFQVPLDFATAWLRDRIFEQRPKSLPIPVSPTRDFCVALFTAKIEATIGNIGDMIGWDSDHNTVGPMAAAAKQSLLRLIPHMMPVGEASLYRLVLDHGDFGIHNMSIMEDGDDKLLVTSVYDWEVGCIVPAILSDPLMIAPVDLETDGDANPIITRVPEDTSPERLAEYATWAETYCKALFSEAPDFEKVIRAGKDARHLWFALRGWRGDDPEEFFGELGKWAEKRMEELGIGQGDSV